MTPRVSLKDGSRVAVIGGGPAGSFFAHFIQKYTPDKEIDITIFDGKDFLKKGPQGCNLCAGVLSESLHQNLLAEGIFLPDKRIINRVEGYELHVDRQRLLITCTENRINDIATVYRGNGPRFSNFPHTISFDDFLLTWAQDMGAKIIPFPVWDIKIPHRSDKPLSILFSKGNKFHHLKADLVVGAFGVNSFMMKKFQNMGFGYIPPSTLTTFQAELQLSREKVQKEFGNYIHIYIPKSKIIRYATVIPKGDYVSLTLIGKKNVTSGIFSEFINLQEIRKKIPSTRPQCFCFPRIAISPSRNCFTHRMVIIGDASFSRHYKNGIESAYITAKLAAETASQRGIDSFSFYSSYYKKAKKLIIHDNYYGRFLYFMEDIISSVPLFTHSHLSLAQKKRNTSSSQKIRYILWNMFTGNLPYKKIFKISLDIRLQLSLLWSVVRMLLTKLKTTL